MIQQTPNRRWLQNLPRNAEGAETCEKKERKKERDRDSQTLSPKMSEVALRGGIEHVSNAQGPSVFGWLGLNGDPSSEKVEKNRAPLKWDVAIWHDSQPGLFHTLMSPSMPAVKAVPGPQEWAAAGQLLVSRKSDRLQTGPTLKAHVHLFWARSVRKMAHMRKLGQASTPGKKVNLLLLEKEMKDRKTARL